ncbi:MAG: hypothetical protein IJ933_01675 [Bacteroidales bacterium]|nr:hypothetical protein [Bacteroidales bacterium]
MKTRSSIFKALMALLVIIIGTNFNAEAQLGGLINAAKNKAKANKEQKAAQEQANLTKPVIPQPVANAKPVIFSLNDTAVCMWNPAALELTMTTSKGGNTPGAVYKLNPTTGAVTDQNGASKGSLSNDGTIESPNLGTLQFKEVKGYALDNKVYQNGKEIGAVAVRGTVQAYHIDNGRINTQFGKTSDGVSPLFVAYVYFGLLTSKQQFNMWTLGYDPDKKYTTAELEDMVNWLDKNTINEIMEYESSRPYAGWDRESHPELKNCKVAAIGLISDAWKENSETIRHVNYGAYNIDWDEKKTHYDMKYYAIYELTDGRNIAMICTASKECRSCEIKFRHDEEFHEVTDWQRK